MRIFAKLKKIPKEIKWFIQRGRRGYADCDTWDYHTYLSNVISGGLRQMARTANGWPESLSRCAEFGDECGRCREINGKDRCPSMEAWSKVLNDIAEGFERYKRNVIEDELLKLLFKGRVRGSAGIIEPEPTNEEWDEYRRMSDMEESQFKEATIPMFGKYFRTLWD